MNHWLILEAFQTYHGIWKLHANTNGIFKTSKAERAMLHSLARYRRRLKGRYKNES